MNRRDFNKGTFGALLAGFFPKLRSEPQEPEDPHVRAAPLCRIGDGGSTWDTFNAVRVNYDKEFVDYRVHRTTTIVGLAVFVGTPERMVEHLGFLMFDHAKVCCYGDVVRVRTSDIVFKASIVG